MASAGILTTALLTFSYFKFQRFGTDAGDFFFFFFLQSYLASPASLAELLAIVFSII
jgi:hypothetical protein